MTHSIDPYGFIVKLLKSLPKSKLIRRVYVGIPDVFRGRRRGGKAVRWDPLPPLSSFKHVGAAGHGSGHLFEVEREIKAGLAVTSGVPIYLATQQVEPVGQRRPGDRVLVSIQPL